MIRKIGYLTIVCLTLMSTASAGIFPDDEILLRGDANNDGSVNGADISFISAYLYNGGDEPPCANQADVDDNGLLNVSDSVYLSNYLYQGGSPPPYPGASNSECTEDTTTPNLSCDVYPCS